MRRQANHLKGSIVTLYLQDAGRRATQIRQGPDLATIWGTSDKPLSPASPTWRRFARQEKANLL